MRLSFAFRALAGAGLVALAAPGLAAPEDFRVCDGYLPPNAEGDGLAGRPIELAALVAARGDGAKAIAACEAALNDPALLPAYVMRRASLIRARGIHRFAAGARDAAYADFDLAGRTAAPLGDGLYERSLAPGAQLLRAYGSLQAGAAEAAVTQSREAAAMRPIDTDFGQFAARIQLAANRDWDQYAATQRALARYDPSRLQSLLAFSFLRGRFEDVVALQPLLRFDLPEARGGYQLVGAADRHVDMLITRIQIEGIHAYALAALGRADEARQVLRTAEIRVERAMTRPPNAPGRSTPSRDAMTLWRAHAPRGPEADAALARWRRFVDLRLRVAAGETAGVAAELQRDMPPHDPALLDILRALRRADPGPSAFSAREGEIEQTIASVISRLSALDLRTVLAGLPDAESSARQPHYDGGSDSSILMTEGGYMSRAGPIEGSRTIKFTSTKGTEAMVAELAFLRAAELAREQGKSGFIVLGRRIISRTTTMGYGNSFPSGFEAEIDVVFVDPGAMPAGFEGQEWRVVEAEAIFPSLHRIYVTEAEASRERARAARRRR